MNFVTSFQSVRIFSTVFTLILSTGIYAFGSSPLDCNEYFKTHYPVNEFSLIRGGMALDKRTNLIWQRCNVGEFWADSACKGFPSRLSWDEGLIAAESSRLGGYDDWRLPSVKELKELAEPNCLNPAINTYVFESVLADIYWTSKTNLFNSLYAWGVFMFNGYDFSGHAKKNPNLVLLVRENK